jgi:hypothetical protein
MKERNWKVRWQAVPFAPRTTHTAAAKILQEEIKLFKQIQDNYRGRHHNQ